MADLSGLITFEDIVANIMLDLGPEAQKSEYARILQWAIRGYGELQEFHLNYVQEAELPISDINTVTLPIDFVSFLSIGIGINGQYWTFTKDNKILSPKGTECGVESLDDESGEGIAIGDGGSISGYGVSGGRNVAYYRIDRKNNRIILNQNLNRDNVILRYITSGVNLDGPTYIPREARECLLAWVHWKRVQRSHKYSRVDKLDAKTDYYEEVDKLRDKTGPTLEEIYDAIFETVTQTAKR
jgi:hypothetical protein